MDELAAAKTHQRYISVSEGRDVPLRAAKAGSDVNGPGKEEEAKCKAGTS